MPGYRPPSTEPRGAWARAIHAKRRAEGISQTGGFEVLGPLLGMGPRSRAAYRAIDMGDRPPRPDEAEVLAEWLGYWPSEATESASPAASDGVGLAELAEAIRDQAQAINDLARQVAALSVRTLDEELAEATGDYVRAHVLEALQALGVVAGLPPK